MRVHIILPHAALTPSGTGRESFSVGKHPRSTDGGMLLVRLYEEGPTRGTATAIHGTLDAVTAVNLGSALMEAGNAFLDAETARRANE